MQAADGNFYGTTYSGGASNSNCTSGTCGTVFKMTPSGALTTLHIFGYTDGANPGASLIQASDGNFYGTTGGGGNCTNFSGGCGTVFKFTPTGTLTTLHSFDRADGALPTTLVQHTNGTSTGRPFVGEQMSTMPAEAGVARFTACLSVWAHLWKSSLRPATWAREYSEEQSIQFATRRMPNSWRYKLDGAWADSCRTRPLWARHPRRNRLQLTVVDETS